jgi:hypothetical protein
MGPRYCGFWDNKNTPAQIRKTDGPPLASRYTVCALWAPACESVEHSRVSREEPVAGSSEHGNVPSGCVQGGKLDYVMNYHIIKKAFCSITLSCGIFSTTTTVFTRRDQVKQDSRQSGRVSYRVCPEYSRCVTETSLPGFRNSQKTERWTTVQLLLSFAFTESLCNV